MAVSLTRHCGAIRSCIFYYKQVVEDFFESQRLDVVNDFSRYVGETEVVVRTADGRDGPVSQAHCQDRCGGPCFFRFPL